MELKNWLKEIIIYYHHINYFFLGAYVPLTMDGKIIVDGVLASCYAVDDHDISHMLTTPLRWFPDFIELIFGDDKEMQAYVNILLGLAKWFSPYMSNEW